MYANLQNITKIYGNIMLTNSAVCKTYEIFRAKVYANLRNITNIYEILRLRTRWFENLRNLSCENLREFTRSFARLRIKTLRNITCRKFTKYYACVSLRRLWKLTKYFCAKTYASFRTEKFPDVLISLANSL